jgi:hypothetical protein
VDYVEVRAARALSGLRVVLTAGAPGPWGEALKGLLNVKRVPYTPVRQVAGEPNDDLRDWTGLRNAPVAVLDDEPPRSHWADLIALAERLAPEPRLVPADTEQRVRMFGLCQELAGEGGLGWQRRLLILRDVLANPATSAPVHAASAEIGRRYGYSTAAAAEAPHRVAEILTVFARQLRAQRERGSAYLIGGALSALDVYWAAFCAMVEPLPQELCPLDPGMRASYTLTDPIARAALDSALLAHRDVIYREQLQLPLDF